MDRAKRRPLGLTLGLAAVLIAAGPGVSAQESALDPLLPLGKAFRLEISRPSPEKLRVHWTIADGYYLYRHRIRFEAAPQKLAHGFTLPPGIAKEDAFFGHTEIYRHQLVLELPLSGAADGPGAVSLRVLSQGCADIGICFPPEVRSVRVAVGETVVAEAADPFAPLSDARDRELIFPASPETSGPPESRLPP